MSANDFLQLYFSISLKAAVILFVAGSLHCLWPKAAAATKHLWWTVAVIACLSLPLLTAMLPAWRLPLLPASVAPVVTAQPLTTAPNLEIKYAPQWETFSIETAPTPAVKPPTTVNWSVWLAALWALGVWLVLARIVVGFVSIGFIKRHAQPLEHEAWRALVVEAALALRLKQHVQLRLSDQVSVPLTTGVFRPLVLLPTEALQWSRAQLKTVLLHELAHVKRRDCLTQMLAHLACALYWCNPLVWIAARQLRQTREQACDDEVLAAGTRASEYASCLVNVAQSVNAREYGSPVAVGMACSQLGDRVTAILNPALNRRKITRGVVMIIVLLVASLVLPLAAFEPVSQAASFPVAALSPAPLRQAQDAQKQQREIEKHLREIEKHRQEIREVHSREIEKHLRELEKLQGTAQTAEMKARLEAELKHALESDQTSQHELEAQLRELSTRQLNEQRRQAELELRQEQSVRDAQRAGQESLARALQQERAAEATAQLMGKRAELDAELQRLHREYKDSHPAVREQQDQMNALTERLAVLEHEAAAKHLSQGRAQMELRLVELEARMKTMRRNYTDKHPEVQAIREHIEALKREIELLRK